MHMHACNSESHFHTKHEERGALLQAMVSLSARDLLLYKYGPAWCSMCDAICPRSGECCQYLLSGLEATNAQRGR
jgi:hypothetical protein